MAQVAVVQTNKPVFNWNLTEETTPEKFLVAKSVEDVCAVVNNRVTYPSPVLAVGSMHSVNGCITNTGTILDMSGALISRAAYAVHVRCRARERPTRSTVEHLMLLQVSTILRG
jgi:hypothetical protein